MPTFKPSKPRPTQQPEPSRDKFEREYQTATASSTREPLANLLTNIEGYPWTVTYYKQILGADDSPRPHEISLNETLQQYHKIHNLEVRVQSPLEYEYVKERGSHYFNGSAVIVPGTIKPDRGDMFIADVGDGREAIFTLSDVTPLSYLLDKAYEITYTSVAGTTDKRMSDLEAKVVKTSYFVKDFLHHGQNPILSDRTVSLKKQLDHNGYRLLEMWVQEFVSKRHRHLLVPNQHQPTYDPFMMRFLRRFLDTSQYPVLRDLNWPSHENLLGLNVLSIWDLLNSPDGLETNAFDHRIVQHCIPVDSKIARGSPFLSGLYYQGVEGVIWPTDNAVSGFELIWGGRSDRGQIPPVSDDSAAEAKPDIKAVLADEYYVFSQAFYEHDRVNMSWLEFRLTQVLAQEAVPEQAVLELAQGAFHWPDMERFYFTPILLVLIDKVTGDLNR